MNQHSNPKIRFKEFVNKWNNYKLGQLGNFKSGIGFPDSQQGGTEGIPFFKVSDMNNIGNETEMRNANNYVTQDQIIKNSWKVINETPAIIFAKVGAALMLNRKRLVTRPFLIDNNTMCYSLDESWDKDFGLTLFQTINLPKYAQIGALPSYNASDIAIIKVYVPNIQEQSAIGSLFCTIDDLLASYKENLANYRSLKTTMLTKMFPKAGQTIPEIRMDGFKGEWEIKKFKSISTKRGKSNSKGDDYPAYSVSNQSGLIPQSEQFEGSRLENLEKTSYKIVEPNEFAYIPARINVGSIAFNDLDETVIVSSLYVIFSLDKSINNDFALLFIKSPEFNKEVRRNTEGSVREYLFYENFANIRIPIPPSLEEQQAIGSYFSNLDNLIAAHQEKISQLETLKKKLLQDMFV